MRLDWTDNPLWTPWSTYRPADDEDAPLVTSVLASLADLEPEGPPTVPLRLVVA